MSSQGRQGKGPEWERWRYVSRAVRPSAVPVVVGRVHEHVIHRDREYRQRRESYRGHANEQRESDRGQCEHRGQKKKPSKLPEQHAHEHPALWATDAEESILHALKSDYVRVTDGEWPTERKHVEEGENRDTRQCPSRNVGDHEPPPTPTARANRPSRRGLEGALNRTAALKAIIMQTVASV